LFQVRRCDAAALPLADEGRAAALPVLFGGSLPGLPQYRQYRFSPWATTLTVAVVLLIAFFVGVIYTVSG